MLDADAVRSELNLPDGDPPQVLKVGLRVRRGDSWRVVRQARLATSRPRPPAASLFRRLGHLLAANGSVHGELSSLFGQVAVELCDTGA